MGAYLVLFPRARVITLLPVFFWPFFIELPAVVFLGVWFASQFLSGVWALVGPGEVGGIAWWAHVGGFAGGLVLVWFFVRRGGRRRRRQEADEWGLEGAWRPLCRW